MFSTYFTSPLWRQVADLQRTFDDLFAPAAGDLRGSHHTAAVNITASDDEVVVSALLPGFEREEISLEAEGERLAITAERGPEERPTRVTRTLRLPFAVDTENAKAHWADGILTVTVARPAADQPRRIPVELAN